MKSQKARTIGPRGRLWAISLFGLSVLAPVAILEPIVGAYALGLASAFAALLQHRRANRFAAAHEKLSSELDVVSQRFLKLETVIAALVRERREPGRAAPPPTESEAKAEAEADAKALRKGVDEITAEIGLLSGIVRELANVVSAQEQEIDRLKTRPAPPPAPVVVTPAPEPPATLAPPAETRLEPPALRLPPAPPFAPDPLRGPSRGPSLREPPPREPVRDPAKEAALVEAFDADGLDVYLQPVVTLPQRKVVGYEALARVTLNGEALPPEVFLPVLERYGRTTALDRRMLQRVGTIARHLQKRGSQAAVTYALSPFSLFEPGFLRSLGRLVSDGEGMPPQVIVALPQASWRTLDAEQAAALAELRGRIGFALDRPVDLSFESNALAARGLSQVKVPAALLLRPPERMASPDIAVEDLVAALGRAGIRVVATQVERETDVPNLIDLDLPLAQGGVFAPPRAVRAEVLAPEAPTPPSPPEPPPDPQPQRRPFRDFLRRAV
ncbi:EAL domain-containing protein [Methylobacterium organophilum]|uniref:EAL domain-containing protein n=1 Tax=Methylobacterium organophilum TaxID=410 RepID=UPI001F13A0D2|nr:EAL domain-containing protein [Methylobacterium organophilum]UMY18765.1 EAL domain-containing protein [Methylobacterium organophilum]